MTLLKLEYLVRMSCKSCEDKIRKVLNDHEIMNYNIDFEKELLTLSTNEKIRTITSLLETTGLSVVLMGVSSDSSIMKNQDYGSGVCILYKNLKVQGVIRLYQANDFVCYVEGIIDGLQCGTSYKLCIHKLGDLSNGPESCGDIYETDLNKESAAGFLCCFSTDESGRKEISVSTEKLQLWNVIGRSMVLSEIGQSENRLFCGIIARSSGVHGNDKRVCACDGLTVWEEKEKYAFD